jgi:hypothetical protein
LMPKASENQAGAFEHCFEKPAKKTLFHFSKVS